jgi:hypothetical protein
VQETDYVVDVFESFKDDVIKRGLNLALTKDSAVEFRVLECSTRTQENKGGF